MQEQARKIVMEYFNSHVDKTDNKQITLDDVYVVWFSKTLQNWKVLVSTNVSDGQYYEITHNRDKNETYVDVYKIAVFDYNEIQLAKGDRARLKPNYKD